MRYTFAKLLKDLAKKDKKIVFLTGDLGFNAFEDLKDSLQNRFINAGIAEHNMVTAAAGLAYAGYKPWIYSIAPFVTIKVLEEIRNDVCLQKANVKIVGLGGGFDYGIAGPSHHALEDVGVLSTLPNMKIYAPSFAEDLSSIIPFVNKEYGAAYVRLTKAQKIEQPIPIYKGIRRLIKGGKLTLVTLGSIAETTLSATNLITDKKKSIDMWTISEFPLKIPAQLINSIKETKALCVIEEHVQAGGLGQQMLEKLALRGIKLNKFIHLHAKGYLTGTYGDRQFYLTENGLNKSQIARTLKKLI